MIYVYRNGAVVEKTAAAPRRVVAVISDGMPALKHMATGVVTDSKSHFRAMTRARGCIEVGTDPAASRPQPSPEPAGIETDVKRAIAELRSR